MDKPDRAEIFNMPEDAHIRAMQIFKNPQPVGGVVAVIPHRNVHGSQASGPTDMAFGIPENSRESAKLASKLGFTFTEVDVRQGVLAHEPLDPRLVGVIGENLFSAENLTHNQGPGIAAIQQVYAERPQDVRLRNPSNFQLTNETVLNIPDLLGFVNAERLPLNLVFDIKTPQDAQLVVRNLYDTRGFNGERFIDTAMIKLPLNSFKTPDDLVQLCRGQKEVADRLNVVWVINPNDVNPNDVHAFRSQQAIVDSLKAHKRTGRFSIAELNEKDGTALNEVKNHVIQSGGYWIGSYHPTLENNSQLNMSDPLFRTNWDTAVDPTTLYKIGNQPMLLEGTGACCYKLNDILNGAKYDGRPSLDFQTGQGANFITTDRPLEARDHFHRQGRTDISTLVRPPPGGPASFQPHPGNAGYGFSERQVLAVTGVGIGLFAIAAVAACRRLARRSTSQAQPPQQQSALGSLTLAFMKAWNRVPALRGPRQQGAGYELVEQPRHRSSRAADPGPRSPRNSGGPRNQPQPDGSRPHTHRSGRH